MSESENIIPSNPEVTVGADYHPPESPIVPVAQLAADLPPHKKLPLFVVLLIVLLAAISVFAIYLLIQVRNLTLSSLPSPSPVPSVQPSSDPTINWDSYDINELHLSFRLPNYFSSDSEWLVEVLPGETGSNICFHSKAKTSSLIRSVKAGGIGICGGQVFTINSNSSNFTAGRGSSFNDVSGYIDKSGEYFLIDNNGKSSTTPIDHMLGFESITQSGVAYLKVLGESTNNPGELLPSDYVGAVINSNNPLYPGIVVTMKITENSTMKDFEDIMSTFKFSN